MTEYLILQKVNIHQRSKTRKSPRGYLIAVGIESLYYSLCTENIRIESDHYPNKVMLNTIEDTQITADSSRKR